MWPGNLHYVPRCPLRAPGSYDPWRSPAVVSVLSHGWLLHPLHSLHHESGSIEPGLERSDGVTSEVFMVPSDGMEDSLGRSVGDGRHRGKGIQIKPRRGIGSHVRRAEVQTRRRNEEHSRR